MTRYFCEYAWLEGDHATREVLIETSGDRIVDVTAGLPSPKDAIALPGLTLPGFVNSHSHVFHRTIRGRTQGDAASFWSWRDTMYAVAGRLDPDSLYGLARATYAEMALAGITCVGEFHYLHHGPGGVSYEDPNAMSHAITSAANDAGVRITLLDTCYLQSDIDGGETEGVQRRFDDGGWDAWSTRLSSLKTSATVKAAAAIHSVRAVPRHAMKPITDYARSRAMPLHVHLSEQPAENQACQSTHGTSPTTLLSEEGVLGPSTTAVHATHLDKADIHLLGSSSTSVSMCVTTERDLADGIGPAVSLAQAGSPLCVGSDAHMVIDLLEEVRGVELNQRLISGRRGHLSVGVLARTLTEHGSRSLGWDAGEIAKGRLADLVTIRLDSPRTAGARLADPLTHVIFAATNADVSHTIVGGDVVVEDGSHRAIENVGAELERAIADLLT
jgi:formiminoglutamate deiminase